MTISLDANKLAVLKNHVIGILNVLTVLYDWIQILMSLHKIIKFSF